MIAAIREYGTAICVPSEMSVIQWVVTRRALSEWVLRTQMTRTQCTRLFIALVKRSESGARVGHQITVQKIMDVVVSFLFNQPCLW